MKIWDTAGQEQYKSLTRNFYRNSNGVIIVYDVSNKSSFDKVQEWVQSVIDNTVQGIKMVLVGNKIDLPREVTTEEGQKMANRYDIPFYETSAKENIGIDDCIKTITTEVLKTYKQEEDNRQKLKPAPESISRCQC